MNLNSSFGTYRFSCHCKTENKNMRLVLQHCCKTSWIAMFRLLPPVFKPVNNLICCKTGLMWVGKRPTLLVNSFCSNVTRQVKCFSCPFLRTLNYLCGIVMKTKSCRFNFRFSPDMHRRTLFFTSTSFKANFRPFKWCSFISPPSRWKYRKARTHFPHSGW